MSTKFQPPEDMEYIKGFDKGLARGVDESKQVFKLLLEAITAEIMEHPPSPQKDSKENYYYYRGQVAMLEKIKELILSKK